MENNTIKQQEFEKEFLQIRQEFEKAKECLYTAEYEFGNHVRLLVSKWQELRNRAKENGYHFHPSKLPFSHRVTRYGIDVSVKFKDNRDHIFRVTFEK